MNKDSDNELLSAMLDGELTPEELTQLNKQLQESEQLGSEVAQLQQLSALINSVPAQPAPADLAQGVMSQLLAAPGRPQPRRSWKRWSGVAAFLTAAAAIFLMMQVNQSAPEALSRQYAASELAEASADSVAELPTPAAPATKAAPAAKLKMQAAEGPAPGRMTQQVAQSEVTVIEIDSRETEVAVLLQTLFTAEMLEHRRSKDQSLQAAGMSALVVEVDKADVGAMLAKVKAVAGPNSLSLQRDTDPASLQQKLLAAEALYERQQRQRSAIVQSDQAIAGITARRQAKTDRSAVPGAQNTEADEGNSAGSTPAPPSPPSARRKPQPSGESVARNAESSSNGMKSAATPAPAAGAGMSRLGPTTADPSAPSVKVIFVMKAPSEVDEKDPCEPA